ncbi:uncharacterized protein LOC121863061 isoform X2 [Homarus americanus]|uniref:uncharacterized protein LOC121863061 isoform X2 n=1 Tax=Homarus americanus TaxID=6706 RepID=UPI001C48B401|nr:uncharacterized protein LOC121863061 isoform X2 [Homarus americanus]XP_042217479.1 uncharacterized protein LOC121863061 isoform X2 [Homarus americanus]
MTLILDIPVPRDGRVEERARHTAPWPLFIAVSKIKGAGEGVWTSATLPQSLVFGPCEGHIIKKAKLATQYVWEIQGKYDVENDSADKSISNWVRYINCARNNKERNLFAMQIENEIFYITMCQIERDTELLTWYGETYGNHLGIKEKFFIQPMLKKPGIEGWCQECKISFTSKKLLFEHQLRCTKGTRMYLKNIKKTYAVPRPAPNTRSHCPKRKCKVVLESLPIEEYCMKKKLSNLIPKHGDVCLKKLQDHDVISQTSLRCDVCVTKSSNHCVENSKFYGDIYLQSVQHSLSSETTSDHSINLSSSSSQVMLTPNRSADQGVTPSSSFDQGITLNRPSNLGITPTRLSDWGFPHNRWCDDSDSSSSPAGLDIRHRSSCHQVVNSSWSSQEDVDPKWSSDEGAIPNSLEASVSNMRSYSQDIYNDCLSDDYVCPICSSDEDFALSCSSDEDVCHICSSDQDVDPNWSSDQDVGHNCSSDQDVNPNWSSDQ